jgi:fructose-1,6-bisphosphatase/inositol monophosphatase family enzyme
MQQPYDYLALVPVVEGAGGKITNWSGESLKWLPEVGNISCLHGISGSRHARLRILSIIWIIYTALPCTQV